MDSCRLREVAELFDEHRHGDSIDDAVNRQEAY